MSFTLENEKKKKEKCVQNHLTGIRRPKYQFFRINQSKQELYEKV